jgi:cytochrome oxidase Cu insertion factor (SCO1/SenC/PrrC family)
MADTQPAPHPATMPQQPNQGSIEEAHDALLGLMNPEGELLQEEEATPTEEEESIEETQDESLEEESEEESEKPEEEIEEGDEEETEESDEEVEDEPDVYAVTVNGEEREVTINELLKGYSRQSDYTKKTQELAEQRKGFEGTQQQVATELQQIQLERQQYVHTLQNLIEGSMGNLDKFSNVDWESLKANDPIEFVTKREEFREAQEKIQHLQREQQEAQQRQAQESQKQHQEILKQEHAALIERVPEWGKPEKQKALAKELRSYATSVGFSDEELNSLIDHRSIMVLLKASKYDQLQNADLKTKKVKNKPKLVRAGKGKPTNADSKSKRSAKMKRLQQTGRVDDAALVMEDFVNL